MKTAPKKMTYALKDGSLVRISEVERGLACHCLCPACGEPLVAKKGTKMMHHFSHSSGTECEYGYETSLHLAAKEMLSKARTMMIPAAYIEFPNSSKDPILLSEAMEIPIEHVELEKRLGNIIPDVVIYTKNKVLLVEIHVTHPVDEDKRNKLVEAGISAIEIDLSKKDKIDNAELEDSIINQTDDKHWIHNAYAYSLLNQFYSLSEEKQIIDRRPALHIDYCPINARVWHNKPYANYIDDCSCCEYLIGVNENRILCSGKRRISTLEDLKQALKNSN